MAVFFQRQSRSKKRGTPQPWLLELLVQWVGCSAADATWEKIDEFKEAHPEFQLEDELFSGEGGSVVDTFVGCVYRRRKKKTPAT
jgi:hypothetical protein